MTTARLWRLVPAGITHAERGIRVLGAARPLSPAQLAEEQAILNQLARLGRVVTLGFANNPGGGIFEHHASTTSSGQ